MRLPFKTVLPLAVLVAGALGAWALIQARAPGERQERLTPPPLVRIAFVEPADLEQVVSSQGTVQPRTQATLVTQVGGRIVETGPGFAAGGAFQRGELLVGIEPRDYELALKRARAQVSQAEVRLRREEAEAELARKEWERAGDGEPGPLVLREPQLADARATLEAARSAVAQAELELERTRVSAPFRGRVREKLADLGQVAAPGTPVAAIYATDFVEIRLPVQLGDLAFLDLPRSVGPGGRFTNGPRVRLTGSYAGRDLTWEGRIVRTAGEIDPGTRMLHLIAEVENPAPGAPETGPPLPVGLFVEAEIAGTVLRDVVEIPRAALRGADRLLVVDQDDRLRFRTVSVVRRTRDNVVIDHGLEPGERICLSPLEAVTDGMRVRTVDEGEPAGDTP